MITQKEIASRLGISRTTVARAINGSPSIKPETKEKIMKLVRETKYEKNYVGSSLASKKNKKVYALIVHSKNQFYTNEVKRGMEDAIKEYQLYGYKIKIIATDINDPELQIQELKKIVKKKDLAGLIITPLDKKKVYEILENRIEDIEIISLGIKLHKKIYHIGPNYENQGQIAAGIMASLLRKEEKLLVIDNGDDKVSSRLYLEGFMERISSEDIEIIGKIKCNGIEDSIQKIIKICNEEKIKGIYINRYAHDIFDKLPRELLEDKKIVTNGLGILIKKLLKERVITATVMEEIKLESYLASKTMFEKLYKGKEFTELEKVSKSRIILKENLSES